MTEQEVIRFIRVNLNPKYKILTTNNRWSTPKGATKTHCKIRLYLSTSPEACVAFKAPVWKDTLIGILVLETRTDLIKQLTKVLQND